MLNPVSRTLLTLFLVQSLLLQLSCESPQMEVVYQTNEQDSATALNEPLNFILKKQAINADFDYSKLSSIDDNTKDEHDRRNLMPIFDPVRGNFNYYQFIATAKGHAYNSDGPLLVKDFHDILIVRINNEDEIIDAYWYTLEWGEMPLQYDLFRSSVKNIKLSEGLPTTQLKFKREYDSYKGVEDVRENGLLHLRTNRK